MSQIKDYAIEEEERRHAEFIEEQEDNYNLILQENESIK